jgi:hypothetical protein
VRRGNNSTLSLTSALDGVGGQVHAPVALPQGQKPGVHCAGGWVGPSATLDGCGKSRPPTGIRSADGPAHSESLYRLSYTGGYCYRYSLIITQAVPKHVAKSSLWLFVGLATQILQ